VTVNQDNFKKLENCTPIVRLVRYQAQLINRNNNNNMADRQREAINKRKQIEASRRNKKKASNIYISVCQKMA